MNKKKFDKTRKKNAKISDLNLAIIKLSSLLLKISFINSL
jgi:hypothetical protein